MGGLLHEQDGTGNKDHGKRDDLGGRQAPDDSAPVVPAQHLHPEPKKAIKEEVQPKQFPMRFFLTQEKHPKKAGDRKIPD